MSTSPSICLPQQFSGSAMPGFMAQLIEGSGGHLPSEISFDFSTLGFIRPSGVVFLSNLTRWLSRKGCRVFFIGLSPANDSHRYLDDSLFFEEHLGSKLNEFAQTRGTTLPLQQVKNSDSPMWVNNTLLPWVDSKTYVGLESLHVFAVCIKEIFNNIWDHTDLDIGSIFAQHFPKEDQIIISVADFGPGIPEVVRSKCPDLMDNAAIKKAIEDGFTTQTTPRNRGAGLDYLIDTVVLQNRGKVTIYSGTGMVSFSCQEPNKRLKAVGRAVEGFSPGTLFEIRLRTDTIEICDSEEALEW